MDKERALKRREIAENWKERRYLSAVYSNELDNSLRISAALGK
jgi:hypothetical protein